MSGQGSKNRNIILTLQIQIIENNKGKKLDKTAIGKIDTYFGEMIAQINT